MSMFDLVIGNSGFPLPIIDVIYEVPLNQVARYRDHWLERSGEDTLILAVYTRMGGGNREDYAEQIKAIHQTPNFLSDDDDAYDSTYSTLRFGLRKSDFFKRLHAVEAELGKADNVLDEERDAVWDEMWDAAEHLPRDMANIWRAIIGGLEEAAGKHD